MTNDRKIYDPIPHTLQISMNNLVEDLLDPAATGNASMEAFNRVMTQANLQSVDTDSL